VGRNQGENEAICALQGNEDFLLTALSVPGPIVLASSALSGASRELAAAITAAYSDALRSNTIDIRVTQERDEEVLQVPVQDKEAFKAYMI
jgi:predicted ribosome quality control (RQC) complex YloA/Tae2 family protein